MSQDLLNIAVLTGSRADYGLLEPVLFKLNEECDLHLLVTGSHLSKEYGETWRQIPDDFQQIHIPILQDYESQTSINTSIGMGIDRFSLTLCQIKPDKLVILGDRYEALAAAIAAYNLRIPIVHIQGGDRTTGSLDDGYRDCISRLSSLHLVADEQAYCNVDSVSEGPIHIVGSLACVLPDVEPNTAYDYILLIHPPLHHELSKIVAGLDSIADKNVLMIGSNADEGGRTINEYLKVIAQCVPNWVYAESVPREEYISYLKGAKALIGNSSSGIFEAPVCQTKTINIGDRQDGRSAGPSIYNVSADGIPWALSCMDREYNCPYYKPDTVEQIVKHIL